MAVLNRTFQGGVRAKYNQTHALTAFQSGAQQSHLPEYDDFLCIMAAELSNGDQPIRDTLFSFSVAVTSTMTKAP